MFNLIITIVSIALVIGLAAASVFYGGSAFTQGTAKSTAATVLSQAQQVQAAAALYTSEKNGAQAQTISDLTTGNYMKSAPGAITDIARADAAGVVTWSTINAEVCKQLVGKASGVGAVMDGATTPEAITTAAGCTADAAGVGKNSFVVTL